MAFLGATVGGVVLSSSLQGKERMYSSPLQGSERTAVAHSCPYSRPLLPPWILPPSTGIWPAGARPGAGVAVIIVFDVFEPI